MYITRMEVIIYIHIQNKTTHPKNYNKMALSLLAITYSPHSNGAVVTARHQHFTYILW